MHERYMIHETFDSFQFYTLVVIMCYLIAYVSW